MVLPYINEEHDQVVKELENMSSVSVLEDFGSHEENNELVPEGHPNEGGMWIREVRVSLEEDSLRDVLNTLSKKSSDSNPRTIIQDKDVVRGEEATIRICCDEDR